MIGFREVFEPNSHGVCKQNERDGISFELDKEIEKNVFRLVMCVGQIENSESPWGIELQTFEFRAPMFYHWAMKTLEKIREIRLTRVLYTARISNGDSVMFVNRMREMELSGEV